MSEFGDSLVSLPLPLPIEGAFAIRYISISIAHRRIIVAGSDGNFSRPDDDDDDDDDDDEKEVSRRREGLSR